MTGAMACVDVVYPQPPPPPSEMPAPLHALVSNPKHTTVLIQDVQVAGLPMNPHGPSPQRRSFPTEGRSGSVVRPDGWSALQELCSYKACFLSTKV